MSDADAILEAGARPIEAYDLNGTKVWLKSLAFSDYGPWLKDGTVEVTTAAITRLLVRSIVNEDGVRIFADKDAAKIAEMEPAAVVGMFRRVMSLSTFTVEAQEEAAEDFAQAQNGEASIG